MAEEQDPTTRESQPAPRGRAPAAAAQQDRPAPPSQQASRDVQPKKEEQPSTPADPQDSDMVILSNKRPQVLTVSTDTGNGPEELKLPPHGSSVPVNKDHLTPYTRSMIEKGHIKERAAKAQG